MRSPQGPQPPWHLGLALAGLGVLGAAYTAYVMAWPLVKGLLLCLAALR